MKHALSLVVVLYLGVGITASAADPVGPSDSPGELRFKGYPDAPAFTVVKGKKRSRRNRCSRCHSQMDPNPTIRELADAPHVDGLSHGQGRLWCLECHDQDERDFLRTLLGEKVEFDRAYIVCGTCHPARQKDWYYGGHGKRLNNWRGERVIYNCTHCHDAHEPAITPRQPKSPPPVRAGLKPMPRSDHTTGNHQGYGWRDENTHGGR